MKDENKEIIEIKESEKLERGQQCELDDNALEQAAGGGKSEKWLKEAREWIENH